MGSARSVVLVVGAAGKFAGLVVPALRRRDVAVRALVRDEARAAAARALGATEIAIGDLRDAASLAEATRGVDGVFHIGPAFAADEAAMGVALVEAAQRSGVRKFVFSSVIQPTNIRLANHASKVAVEDALYSSRLEYTILHPANFMQNIGLAWASIRDDGCFGEPFPKEARIARVDYRDVAETAAIALTQDRLAFATLELCAGMYSRMDIVAALSEALGSPVAALQPGFGEWAARARLPYGKAQLQLLARVMEHYQAYGLGGNSLALRAALGREPRSLRAYVQDLVAGQNGARS
ncbi:NmrA/HSCARG family protein [Bordetella bronchiseptica]|uniref:NmrA/HSCARG family protein n=1 Tax=Bordetella bronchiseptica TaxID=518 RepID=UPI000444E294|nr:NmrA/HSCARG family protein [Bordetella bronchiseptica]AWQ09235.1 epimerase [Bordetella bronchiseptica]AXT90387.1 NmrA/HSCARG family protein [Bordetella bronchiseptica]KDB76366.1 NmrA family protein [Bordetella bronchiseptica CARE970018BB]KDC98471.1 NmrA family protein [Bordetella bronchiseptica MBORD670]KDD20054.1 NmrA family protein [Bordetella bronchiseptica MBORD785]